MSDTATNNNTCTLTRIKVKQYGEGKGRGIIAVASPDEQQQNKNNKIIYKKGDIIFTVTPDVTTLYSAFASDYCARCFLNIKEREKQNKNNNNTKSYKCPTCDQFVLCATCFEEIHNEQKNSENNNDSLPFLLRVHQLACGWYQELPAAVTAKGQDTDYLRFVLFFVATSMLEEEENKDKKCEIKTLKKSLLSLDGSEQSQSRENIHFCNVFAKEKMLKTFGSSENNNNNHKVERMRMNGDDLAKVLLITKNNSLGFPFSFSSNDNNNNDSDIIGWSLQNTMCLLNHNCNPNAEIIFVAETLQKETTKNDQQKMKLKETFESTKIKNYENPTFELEKTNNYNNGDNQNQTISLAGCMALRSLRDIYSNNNDNEGEEITISYVNLEEENGFYAKNVKERSKHLLEQYRFLCRCDLCNKQRAELKLQQQQLKK